jgi:signal peptidase I
MTTLFRTLQWIANLSFFGLLLILAFMFLAPRLWEIDFRIVTSGSMTPTIPLGSVVLIRPEDPSFILPDDIVTFKSSEFPNLVVTHRVVEVSVANGERAFRTQGDANDHPDLELVMPPNLLGRVIFHLPFLGYLSGFVRTQQGWLLLVVTPASILLLIELSNILTAIWSSDEFSSKNIGNRHK